jgi:hypothetical protein
VSTNDCDSSGCGRQQGRTSGHLWSPISTIGCQLRHRANRLPHAAGFEAITGEPLADFVFLTVEKAPPFAVGLYRLDTEALEYGERLRRLALRLVAQCLEADRWPAYSDQIEPISLPPWAFQAAEGESA